MPDPGATASTKISIPAICRIPGRGTAILVAPGVLLSSLACVGPKKDAGKLKAVFMENGKQDPIVVPLHPGTFYFNSMFPEYLDYCLTGCDATRTYSIKSVRMPTTLLACSDVVEGDNVLVVQHPLPPAYTVSSDGCPTKETVDGAEAQPNYSPIGEVEVKRFEQVIKKRGDVFYLPVNPNFNSAGCPVFNDRGQLVGIQQQVVKEGEEMVNKVIHIASIVKHMFANAVLNRIENEAKFEDIWKCWYLSNDITSVIRIIQNFPTRDIRQQSIIELCTMTNNKPHVESLVRCGGIKVLLENLHSFRSEQDLVESGFRALWNVSFGNAENTRELLQSGSVPLLLMLMGKFAAVSEIIEYGMVILYNILSHAEFNDSFIPEPEVLIEVILDAMKTFKRIEVILKFGIGALGVLCSFNNTYVQRCIQKGVVDLVCDAISSFPNNEYLNEHALAFFHRCANHEDFHMHSSIRNVIAQIIRAMKAFQHNNTLIRHGNHALWYIGVYPPNRVSIAEFGGLDIISATVQSVAHDI